MRLIDADAIPYGPLPKGDRNYRTYNLDDAYEDGYNDAMVDVRNSPTIVERKTGKWIRGDAEKLTGSQRCSICHKACYKGKDYFNYCPNCGADMRGEGHE